MTPSEYSSSAAYDSASALHPKPSPHVGTMTEWQLAPNTIYSIFCRIEIDSADLFDAIHWTGLTMAVIKPTISDYMVLNTT